jgi:hypothetical protein
MPARPRLRVRALPKRANPTAEKIATEVAGQNGGGYWTRVFADTMNEVCGGQEGAMGGQGQGQGTGQRGQKGSGKGSTWSSKGL